MNCSNETSFEAFHTEVKLRIESFDMDRDLFSDPNENYRQFEEIILKQKLNTLHQKLSGLKSININYPAGWYTVFQILSNFAINYFLS